MTPDEILERLDEYVHAPGEVAHDAAALIRQLQDTVALQRRDLERHVQNHIANETIHDRDARAAMSCLLAHTHPQGLSHTIANTAFVISDAGLSHTIANTAFVISDAMAEERARRADGGP